jgi:diguanylate cyclase (GGDEF)-like protein
MSPTPSSASGAPRLRSWANAGATKVGGFTAGLVVVAWLLWSWRIVQLPALAAPSTIPWWLLALMSAGADLFIIHIQLRRDSYSSSLSEVPLVVGLVFCSPVGLVAARVLGSGAALLFHGRQSGTKLFFNLAQEALTACVAIVVFRQLLGSYDPIGPMGWLAAFAAITVIDALSPTLVVAAISLYEGRRQWGVLPRVMALDLVAGTANASLALIAVLVLWLDVRAAWLLLVVTTVVHLAYRGYTSLSQRYARLELLYGFTKAMGDSVQPESIVRTMLTEARELLRSEVASMVISGTPTVRATLGAGDEVSTDTTAVSLESDEWWQPALTGQVVCLGKPVRDRVAREQLERAGLKDAMAVPLRRGADVVGVLLVCNRSDDVSTFTSDDLKLFETLANHATVSLENGRLVQRLRQEAAEKEHQALHDALTGLPNRRRFQEQVEEALLKARSTGRQMAVMLMDLDRFKEVNDTLGHHTGDLLLREVGRRLERTLHGRGTIARLGGDEFAVLLPSVTSTAEAESQAKQVVRALEQAFSLSEITLEVAASVGVAVAPEHGEEAATLLQRADIAMYAAKAGHAGVRVYEPADDQYTRRRLTLVAELRQAVAERQLIVHYQPQIDLATGRAVGFEALVRWIHPEHGFLPPDEFIPLAEQTGLVRPLTSFVLEEALKQCAAWRRAGNDVGVAVNLSVRSLVDSGITDEVARMLADIGVPASALTLEVTESSIMVDPEGSVAVLEQLRALGVSIAIDDFGTGYSSLTYLRKLPVDEVKVDRSFVMSLAEDENDAAIVQSTIVLGRNLGLRVVAEGVEDAAARDRLIRFGCDAAQGYFYSRPQLAADLGEWLTTDVVEPAVVS